MGPVSRGPGNYSFQVIRSKISNLKITELLYLHILDMNREVPFIQEVQADILADADELKMASRTRKVSGALKKRTHGPN